MKLLIIATAIVLVAPHVADARPAPKRVARPVPQRIEPETQPDFHAAGEAAITMEQCVANAASSDECKSSWRTFDYQILSNRIEVVEHIPETGSNQYWSIYCSRDKMTDVFQCSAFFSNRPNSSSGVSVSRTRTNYAVTWGEKGAFDRTPLIRFDDREPIPVGTKAMYDKQVGELIVGKMRAAQRTRFRWTTWPEYLPADVEMDTTHFSDFDAFFSAAMGILERRH